MTHTHTHSYGPLILRLACVEHVRFSFRVFCPGKAVLHVLVLWYVVCVLFEHALERSLWQSWNAHINPIEALKPS